jgi:hypothetical protein
MGFDANGSTIIGKTARKYKEIEIKIIYFFIAENISI